MKPPPQDWPRISSALFYENAGQAIEWLCSAFGFEVRLKVEGEGGRIEHSELVYGDGVIMVSEANAPGRPDHRGSPKGVNGVNTQKLMIYVDDVEAHYAQARRFGAKIESEPQTHDYGPDYWADRGYSCADPEGHHFWFAQRMRTGSK